MYAILKIWTNVWGLGWRRENTFHCFVSGLFIATCSFIAFDPISLESDLDKAREPNP